jgi:hypothetical protein
MNRSPASSPLVAALVAVLAATAATAACSATPPTGTPGTTAARSPGQPVVRSGDYEVLELGEAMIHARCDEGGFVFVSRKPDAGHETPVPAGARTPPKGLTAERDAAVHEACRAVDYSR